MTSGGARSNSGPPPDVNALVRNRDGKEWTRLPATGRATATPEWPMQVEQPSMQEVSLWRELWAMPQAIVWEADRSLHIVALYVRLYIESMKPDASAATRGQVRSLSTELLLTPDALLRGRYIIKGTPEEQAINEAMARHPAGSATNPPRAIGGRSRAGLVVVPPPVDPADDMPTIGEDDGLEAPAEDQIEDDDTEPPHF